MRGLKIISHKDYKTIRRSAIFISLFILFWIVYSFLYGIFQSPIEKFFYLLVLYSVACYFAAVGFNIPTLFGAYWDFYEIKK